MERTNIMGSGLCLPDALDQRISSSASPLKLWLGILDLTILSDGELCIHMPVYVLAIVVIKSLLTMFLTKIDVF